MSRADAVACGARASATRAELPMTRFIRDRMFAPGGRVRLLPMAEPASRVTYGEYLAAEAVRDTKHEYLRGEIFAMAGGTPTHARLAMAVGHALMGALAGRPCAVFSADLRVRIESSDLSTYPDLVIVGGSFESSKICWSRSTSLGSNRTSRTTRASGCSTRRARARPSPCARSRACGSRPTSSITIRSREPDHDTLRTRPRDPSAPPARPRDGRRSRATLALDLAQ